MWKPRRLTTIWAFTACYRDSFVFSIEQVNSFDYLGLQSQQQVTDVEIKMNRLKQMCRTVRSKLDKKARKDTQIKVYKAMAVRTNMWIRNLDYSKKNKNARSKNWNCRD
jgi:hypothetical protein